MANIMIGSNKIGDNCKIYFIADIAANHDGDLQRAKMLISLAKESGADAVKFQNHNCEKYVSSYGFKQLGDKLSHQSKWKKTVYEVYKDAEVPVDWTSELKEHAAKEEIEYFSTPYDLDMVDMLEPYVNVYKLGSGDINWDEMLIKVAKKQKPLMIATGASMIEEVQHAVEIVRQFNKSIVLMQCNTNYTASPENFKYIGLNVLKTYRTMFPDVVLGLSDHTHGHTAVLGAVALGASVIEKHFTDDNERPGPDHPFSMTPETWKEMVKCTKELELAMGDYDKKVQQNEKDTVILQRRCIRLICNKKAGDIIMQEDIQMQRPAPKNSISPNNLSLVLGKKPKHDIAKGDFLSLDKIG